MYPPLIRITDFPFVKQGITTGPANAILSWRLKLLSARTRSLQFNVLRNPDCKVTCLSDTCPPHPDERKLTRSLGVTLTNYLIVLLCV